MVAEIDRNWPDGIPGPSLFLEAQAGAEVTRRTNKLILGNSSNPHELLRLIDAHGEELHVLNICTILHRIAKSLARKPQLLQQRSTEIQKQAPFRQLLALVRRHAPVCNNMELTNCLWSIATMELRGEEESVLLLLNISKKYLASFDPRNLALSAWALAKLGCTDAHFAWCRLWADAVLQRLNDFETRDMTMVIWAYATVHWRDEHFLQDFCSEVVRKADRYTPQDLGNTLWALATLAYRHEGALAALCQQCFPQAEIFDQQNLSISMWSFATLGYKNMNLFHHITQHATARISTFHSQGMANIVWACAKFQFQQKCLLMTVAEEAIPRVDEFEPQHLAIMAWAYATLEFPNRPLLTALCRAASRKMHIFGPQHMANMTWAMATLAHKDEEFLRLMCQRALEVVQDFNPQECSNLAWALALLTFRDDALLDAISRRSQEIVADFIPQNLGNSAWAYNRLGYRDEELIRTLTRQAAQVLHECAGQEILDLLETISTGGYQDAVDPQDYARIQCWIEDRFNGAREFVAESGSFPLKLPAMSEFDRALAVQDYKDQLASFKVIGLGYDFTRAALSSLGVIFPEGQTLDQWVETARVTALDTKNEGDAQKNVEAQEGLKACRTVCVYKYCLRAPDLGGGAAREVAYGPAGFASGQPNEQHELGLFAATLKHNRGGDGEFQALQACARAAVDLGFPPLGDAPHNAACLTGDLWLHVSEVPCLSCVGAMAQFRRLLPEVRLNLSFTLGRQPAVMNSGGSAEEQRDKSNGSLVGQRGSTADEEAFGRVCGLCSNGGATPMPRQPPVRPNHAAAVQAHDNRL
mmetsp:Transcript_16873/g.39408  ORF Transcript_16873/g.39408 Transcript_16873/m.39408 type:complete len:814 (+) Transcript_16873:164-2605(+)